MLLIGTPSNLILRLNKMRNFAEFILRLEEFGTFAALMFAILGQNRKNLFRKN